ncbi:MAG TPA: carbohydrate ABC transporter substrate-binding protein [Candidatus Ruthenibacterium avium]|uniref:Carbohydrate ABC transporter substrate-binding protein n=1 Tax=Candidatus Ruthenibacterium avium TaxID=2838751 RepID=A0A9D2M2U5_9FIRM|nr:carbohydrate ABC transporter substrate-binding protein [Candidatus Ruthenibacterium avium]
MKKAISTVLALGMSLSMLTACGGATSSSTAASTAASESTAASTSTSAAATGTGDYAGQTLKVAAIETAYGAEMWQQIADGFEAKTGATVELTTDKNLEDVIDPQMKAGNFYDVVHLAAGREKALPETMLKENAIEEVTDVLSMNVLGEDITVGEKIIPGFTGNLTTNPYGDDRVFMMPMFYGPCGLFYNKANFTEGGGDLELPTTWDEFFALADQTDIPLFTYPVAGYLDAFTYALIAEIGGQDFFNKALQYDETVWSSPEMDKMFEILGKLAENTNDATTGYANNDNFTKNQQMILDNEALFMPNGNWVIGEMADAPRAEGFEWGFMALPAIEEGGDRYSYTFFEQSWIPAGAENKELAKVFLTYLYSDEAAEIFAASGAVQPITGMTDKLSDDNKVYYSVYDNGAKAAIGTFATTTPVEGVNIKEDVCFTMDSVVNGTKTVDDWKAAVQASCAALREAM